MRHDRDIKRVLIVDDSSTMRIMLNQIFEGHPNFKVIGLARNAEEAISMEQSLRPDLIAIDLVMPYIDGSQLLSMLGERPSLIKIILSSQTTSHSVRSCLAELGASAFFDKHTIAEDPNRFRQEVTGLMIGQALKKRRPLPASLADLVSPRDACPIPRDEELRLNVLSKLGIGNLDPDYCLDIVARHLGDQANFPVVAITLIGKEQLWVKAGHGIERVTVARSDTVCAHGICHGKPLVISDLAKSTATKALPMVASAPYFRSYAGAPIVTDEGVTLGMVCMLDTKSRQPVPTAMNSLTEAASLAARFIEVTSADTRMIA